MEQESATEFGKREGEGTRSATTVVFVAQGHGLVIYSEQAMVRDRDAVGVACQILEHRFRPVERRLGVDDPLGPAGLMQKTLECSRAAVAPQ